MPVNQAIEKVMFPFKSIAPAVQTTGTITGTTLDLSGGTGGPFLTVLCVIDVGVRTDGTHLITLEDSADNSSFATVAAAGLSGSFPADVTSNMPIKVSYIGGKQYLRVKGVVSGTTTGAVWGALLIACNPRYIA